MVNNSTKPSIADRLTKPHLVPANSGTGVDLLPPDPVIRTRIRATIDNTVPFNRNPRRTRNPLYAEIKESIRNKGLEAPPVVTRKNPSDPYMIKKGGNTRLEILRELWEETGDPQFYSFDCDFEPWTSDLDALISHMIENEMKGGMLFIEKAIGAIEIKYEIEADEQKSISINELSKRITKLGWSIDQSNLGQMLYAHEYLFPIIPEAFWSGAGRDTVKKIRKLLDTCKTFWESVATLDEGCFDDIWKPVFASLDGEGFDLDKAEYELCSAMSVKLDSPFLQLRAEVQAISVGISKGGNRPKDIITEVVQAQQEKAKNAGVKATPPPLSPAKNKLVTDQLPGSQDSHTQYSPTPPTSPDATELEAGEKHHLQETGQSVNTPAAVYGDLSPFSYLLDYEVTSIQEVAYQAAADYADTISLQDYVEYIQETGWHTGYRMLTPIGIDPERMMHWAILWVLSQSLTAPVALLGALRKLSSDVPELANDNLLVVMTFAHSFRCRLIGQQINDPKFNPVQWQTLCELEAAVSLIMDAHAKKKPLNTYEGGD